MHDWIIPTYASYLALSIVLAVWVGRTLRRSGRVLLVDVFRGDEVLADSVNQLLSIGFYLINLGFVICALTTYEGVVAARTAIETVSTKVGAVLLVLGVMHFANLLGLGALRARTTARRGRDDGELSWRRPSAGPGTGPGAGAS